MAYQVTLESIEQGSTTRIGILRLAASTAATAWLIFALCWLGTFFAFPGPIHAYIGLFTNETQSVEGLAEEGVWSLLFGALSGGLIAALYNLFAGLDRR